MDMKTILCVTLNPVIDVTMFVNHFQDQYRNETRETRYVAGGKGNNVARALLGLGESARAMNVLGGSAGHWLSELLHTDGIENSAVWVSGETRLVCTIVDENMKQHAYFAPPAIFHAEDCEQIRHSFIEALNDVAAVCLCGSSPSEAGDRLFGDLLQQAKSIGLVTLLDTYGRAMEIGLSAIPTIAKCNLAEAQGLVNRDLSQQYQQCQFLEQQLRIGIEWAVLTLGSEGALFACDNGIWMATPPSIQAVNTIGCGDSMSAGLIAGRLRGLSAEESFRLGMASAAADTLTWDAGRVESCNVSKLINEINLVRIK